MSSVPTPVPNSNIVIRVPSPSVEDTPRTPDASTMEGDPFRSRVSLPRHGSVNFVDSRDVPPERRMSPASMDKPLDSEPQHGTQDLNPNDALGVYQPLSPLPRARTLSSPRMRRQLTTETRISLAKQTASMIDHVVPVEEEKVRWDTSLSFKFCIPY